MKIFVFPRKFSSYFWLVLFGFLLSGLMATRNFDASLTAQLASPLRQLIGNEAVAELESLLFGVQDSAKRFQYEAGLAKPEAPWAVASEQPTVSSDQYTVFSPQYPVSVIPDTPSPVVTLQPTIPNIQYPLPTPTKETLKPEITTTPLPTPAAWKPDALMPLGSLAGEGVWSAYLHNPAGEAVAYRTFLQPDPERPFTVVAIVAFDLTKTRLNFVLGTQEPRLEDSPFGTGIIPEADKTADILLAAFNGGFMATHGQYGAMANGVEALPPQEGLATVAMGENGRIRIGEWGSDILASDKLVSWRQNAYMVVQNGKITPETSANSLYYWSGSINNEVVTWRSGLGLSQDGNTLYYFAGPSLHMPALGQTMVTAGVENGMLLDINPYWVHFTAVHAQNGELTATSLMDGMNDHTDRFLRMYQRDFFYVTVQ